MFYRGLQLHVLQRSTITCSTEVYNYLKNVMIQILKNSSILKKGENLCIDENIFSIKTSVPAF
jgi:hypothetical protein